MLKKKNPVPICRLGDLLLINHAHNGNSVFKTSTIITYMIINGKRSSNWLRSTLVPKKN